MRLLFFLFLGGVLHAIVALWFLGTYRGTVSRRTTRRVWAAAGVLTFLLVGARAASMIRDTLVLRVLLGAAMAESLVVIFGLVPLAALTLVRHAVQVLGRKPAPGPEAVPETADDTATTTTVGRRGFAERAVGAGIFAATGSVLGWGMVRGRHAYVIEELVVRIPGWPRALEGYTLAQVSDIHVGNFMGERELDEGLELVRRVRPDLLVATGDLVDSEAEHARLLGRKLADLAPRDGVFAILGNHDHYAGAPAVAAHLRDAGVRVLCNEGVVLRPGDGGGFGLLGVDDLAGRSRGVPGFRGPDLYAAGRALAPQLPRILLAHQPVFLDEAAGRAALQLSGHTHGGQINPGFRPADLVMKYVAGRYERGGTTLWVNRGFGVAGPPTRVNAPPEVTKIVIVAG